MSREAFHNLLKRYLDGKCTEQERKIVEQWYGMLDDEDLKQIDVAELASIDEKLWTTINARINLAGQEIKTAESNPTRPLWQKLAVAASLIGTIMIAVYFTGIRENTQAEFLTSTSSDLVIEINQDNKPMDVKLQDGTRVTLEPGTELRYPKNFTGNKREVFVQGEAFFDVEKDQSRPFYVFSNNLITQVVGTSFIVKANDDKQQNEVVVLTGKVIVIRNEKNNNIYRDLLTGKESKVVLTPNQMVVYDRDTKDLVVSLVRKPEPIAAEDQPVENFSFVFNDTPLSAVLEGIEKTYGIEIVNENQEINTCTFTGDIKDQDLYSKLDLICQSVGATYEIEGTKIRIYGGKCN